jgi:hypothetical protein
MACRTLSRAMIICSSKTSVSTFTVSSFWPWHPETKMRLPATTEFANLGDSAETFGYESFLPPQYAG